MTSGLGSPWWTPRRGAGVPMFAHLAWLGEPWLSRRSPRYRRRRHLAWRQGHQGHGGEAVI
eukprot:jgi/Mesvir1/2984/Mv26555-RA.1